MALDFQEKLCRQCNNGIAPDALGTLDFCGGSFKQYTCSACGGTWIDRKGRCIGDNCRLGHRMECQSIVDGLPAESHLVGDFRLNRNERETLGKL